MTKTYPHPAPGGWPFPVYKPTKYRPPPIPRSTPAGPPATF